MLFVLLVIVIIAAIAISASKSQAKIEDVNKGTFDSYIHLIISECQYVISNNNRLGTKTIVIGPYWTQYDNTVLWPTGAIGIGIDNKANQSVATELGFERREIEGDLVIQKMIKSPEIKIQSKAERGALIERVYNTLVEEHPDTQILSYDEKEQFVIVYA